MVKMSKEYQKEYYEKNKERILETMNREVQCDVCKSFVRKCKLNRHKQTNKCKSANDQKLNDPNVVDELKAQMNEIKLMIANLKNN
jgi:hypothetical protein